ncbi:MAG TPA: hypothetical protein VN969_46195 [Streptosporangiaceae bacterium]|nr:hypothetical protein [Streptosporangiaceae bacterium]
MAFRAHRIISVLAVAATVVTCGATAAHATEDPGPSIILNGITTGIAIQGPNDSLIFYWAYNGSSTWNEETVGRPRHYLLRALNAPQ